MSLSLISEYPSPKLLCHLQDWEIKETWDTVQLVCLC